MAMTKTSVWLPWIVATATISGCFEEIEDEPPDDECDFSYENAIFDGEGVDVFYLYLSSSTASEWGPDLLDANILPYGATVVVEDVPRGSWDTRVVDEDGYPYSVYGIDCDGEDLHWRITVGNVN